MQENMRLYIARIKQHWQAIWFVLIHEFKDKNLYSKHIYSIIYNMKVTLLKYGNGKVISFHTL